jgi:hypothetical protein
MIDDPDAIIKFDECDGIDGLFYRLEIKGEYYRFLFHLAPEQVSVLKEALK